MVSLLIFISFKNIIFILLSASFEILFADSTQLAFTCSKLAIETVEQGVKYIRRQWRCFGVFVVNFEHVIAGISRFQDYKGKL